MGRALPLTRGVLGQRDRIEITQRPLPDGCRDGQTEGDNGRGGEASDETPQQAVALGGPKGRWFGGICAHQDAGYRQVPRGRQDPPQGMSSGFRMRHPCPLMLRLAVLIPQVAVGANPEQILRLPIAT